MSDQWSDGQENYISMELRPTTIMGAFPNQTLSREVPVASPLVPELVSGPRIGF